MVKVCAAGNPKGLDPPHRIPHFKDHSRTVYRAGLVSVQGCFRGTMPNPVASSATLRATHRTPYGGG